MTSAIVTPPPSQQLVICADTLVAGRHFPLDTSAHAIGWKSVAVNLSDLAAMGAKPHSILLALSLPPLIMTGWLDLVRVFLIVAINLVLAGIGWRYHSKYPTDHHGHRTGLD